MRRLLAVLGGDVSASLSPLLHMTADRALGLDIAYVPFSCPTRADFERAVDALRVLHALGANVTIPHKIAAMERADRVSTTAQEIGAVNTLSFRDDGSTEGDNSDGPGLRAVLEALPPETTRRVQILGAGGSARAAAWAAVRLSPESVTVTARSQSEILAEQFGIQARPLAPVRGATLVISTLPPSEGLARSALSDWIDVSDASRGPAVCDLAYGSPTESSPLVRLARAMGLNAWDGRGMLVEQAALSLSWWTGGEVSLIREAMRTALPFDSTPGRI